MFAFAESCNTPYLPDGREGFEQGRLTFEIDEIGVVVQFGQETAIDMKKPIARETTDSEIDIRAIGPCSDRDRTEEYRFRDSLLPAVSRSPSRSLCGAFWAARTVPSSMYLASSISGTLPVVTHRLRVYPRIAILMNTSALGPS